MQTETRTEVEFRALTIERSVSGGKVAMQIREDGRTVYWMNGRHIDRETFARKVR